MIGDESSLHNTGDNLYYPGGVDLLFHYATGDRGGNIRIMVLLIYTSITQPFDNHNTRPDNTHRNLYRCSNIVLWFVLSA